MFDLCSKDVFLFLWPKLTFHITTTVVSFIPNAWHSIPINPFTPSPKPLLKPKPHRPTMAPTVNSTPLPAYKKPAASRSSLILQLRSKEQSGNLFFYAGAPVRPMYTRSLSLLAPISPVVASPSSMRIVSRVFELSRAMSYGVSGKSVMI